MDDFTNGTLDARSVAPAQTSAYPELGYIRLSKLQSMTMPVPPGSVGMGLEQDMDFNPNHSLSVYAEAVQ